MTKQEKIEFIKQKCVEANPSIMDLEFGCKVIIPTKQTNPYRCEYVLLDTPNVASQGTLWDGHYTLKEKDISVVKYDLSKIEIIGRDIRLADVVIALRKVHMERVHPVGYNWFTIEMLHFCCNEWNLLKDNLNDQSDECVEFIYKLLN